jgi:hypothetical protein
VIGKVTSRKGKSLTTYCRNRIGISHLTHTGLGRGEGEPVTERRVPGERHAANEKGPGSRKSTQVGRPPSKELIA